MSSQKAVLISDIHFDQWSRFSTPVELLPGMVVSSRLLDIYDVCKQAVDCAVANEADLYILGDLFHNRSSLSPEALFMARHLFDYVDKYQVPCTILAGNHDQFDLLGRICSTRLMSSITTSSIETPLVVDNLALIPYIHDHSKIIEFIAKEVPKTTEYIFGHFGIIGAKLNASDTFIRDGVAITDLNLDRLTNFKHMFLGHYHIHQTINNTVTYCGSPMHHSFHDCNVEKGFILLDRLTGHFELVPTKYKPFITLVDPTDETIEGLDAEAFYRIQYSSAPEQTTTNLLARLHYDLQIAPAKNTIAGTVAGKDYQSAIKTYVNREVVKYKAEVQEELIKCLT